MTSINAGIDGVFLRRATPDDAAQVQAILNSEVSVIDPTHGRFGIDIAKQIIESPGDPSPTWLFSERDVAGDNLKAMGDEVLGDEAKLIRLVKIIGKVLHTKLAKIESHSTELKVPIRAYRCPICYKWHLTSQSR